MDIKTQIWVNNSYVASIYLFVKMMLKSLIFGDSVSFAVLDLVSVTFHLWTYIPRLYPRLLPVKCYLQAAFIQRCKLNLEKQGIVLFTEYRSVPTLTRAHNYWWSEIK